MPIISFWSDGKSETGKTVSLAAITTFLSIENNYKTLLFNTNYNDETLQNCFWPEEQESSLLTKNRKFVDISEGTTGLVKAIASNKTAPEIVTNYTRVVLKKRFEILTDTNVIEEDYNKQKPYYKEVMKMASKYYDLVFTDINGSLDDPNVQAMLDISDLIVVMTSQKLNQIKEYMKLKKNSEIIKRKNTILILGRYDKDSKYTCKNVGRFIGEEFVYGIPYNTLFFEACNEGKVIDYFIRYRKNNPTERNSLFIESVSQATEGIIYYLKEMQTRPY